MFRLSAQLLLVSAILAGGCKKDPPDAAAEERVAKTEQDGHVDRTDEPTTGPGLGGEVTSPGVPTPTDPEILHIVTTANAAEVETASLALKKSANVEVKTFATQMITEHGNANMKTEALAGKTELKPENNSTSSRLQRSHETLLSELGNLDTLPFDKAYVDHAVQAHTEILSMIDQVLIPSADNEELRALLTELRPTIEAHLGHAKELQTALAAPPTDETL